MCGVVAMWDDTLPAEALGRSARAAADRLRHRGPDGEGLWVAPWGTVALAHRRLAIRGLGMQGAQPMIDPAGAGVLSFNGELFEVEPLREELARGGVAFRGSSDTEILSHALARWGVADTLPRIHGQFAFAWLELATRRLHLVRDRLGIRPLYFARAAGRLAVASEQKALLPLAWVDRSPRTDAMLRYLALGRTDDVEGETLIAGIASLPAAHHAIWDGRAFSLGRYWRLDEQPAPTAAPELRAHLERAVGGQLVSDVPVGAMVSGGLDSSTVTLLADLDRRQHGAREPLHLFAYHDEQAEADERVYQRAVLEAVRGPCEVHWVSSSPRRFVADLDHYLAHQEEPYQDLSSYAEYCIAREASLHGVKVLLNGLGGDEVFVGYPAYFGPLVRELVATGELRAALQLYRSAGQIAGTGGGRARRNLMLAALYHSLPAPARNAVMALRAGWKGGLRGPILARAAGDAWRTWHPSDGRHATNASLRASIESWSLPRYLTHSDRMCLAFGVEGRVPLLDETLIERAFGVPVGSRLSRRGLKEGLRQAVANVLPPLVRDRTWKLGFHAPITPYVDAAEEPLRAGLDEVRRELDAPVDWTALPVAARWRWGNLGCYLKWVAQTRL